MVDTVRGVLRVRKWPKKRGTPKSALQRWWNDWFRQANLLAKYADGMAQARAIAMTKGSGLYPRDVMLSAMRGRLYYWTDETGWTWYPMAAIQDISDALDVLAQTIGSVLVRATDRWRAADDEQAGRVLTHQGPGAAPKWVAPAGGGGFVGGALCYRNSGYSLPNNTTRQIPFDAEVYDTAGIHESVTNPSRLTVPVGTTWARLHAMVNIPSNTSGYRQAWFYKNGAEFTGNGYLDTSPRSRNTQDLTIVSAVVPVVAGDYFEFNLHQTSGSARIVGSSPNNLSFSMELL